MVKFWKYPWISFSVWDTKYSCIIIQNNENKQLGTPVIYIPRTLTTFINE